MEEQIENSLFDADDLQLELGKLKRICEIIQLINYKYEKFIEAILCDGYCPRDDNLAIEINCLREKLGFIAPEFEVSLENDSENNELFFENHEIQGFQAKVLQTNSNEETPNLIPTSSVQISNFTNLKTKPSNLHAQISLTKIYTCEWPECGLKFTRRDSRLNHQRSKHTNDKPFVCKWPTCGMSFVKRFDLRNHFRKHSGERPYRCDFPDCERLFSRLDTRNNHRVRQHSKARLKKYNCNWPDCNIGFAKSFDLKKHLETHSGNKPFYCDWEGCGKTFTLSSSLTTHRRTHINPKMFKCDWPGCGEGFRRNVYLTVHKRIHTGEKPFLCKYDDCSFRCAAKNTLRNHHKTHGEKLMVCTWPGCDYRTKLKRALTVHRQAVHEDYKPHKCNWPQCAMRFVTSGALKKHILQHTGEKPFQCEYPDCRRTFTSKGNMKAHFRNIHKNSAVEA